MPNPKIELAVARSGELTSRGRIQAFFRGMREGARLYAYWMDGIQFVGDNGTMLKTALRDMETMEKEVLDVFEDCSG